MQWTRTVCQPEYTSIVRKLVASPDHGYSRGQTKSRILAGTADLKQNSIALRSTRASKMSTLKLYLISYLQWSENIYPHSINYRTTNTRMNKWDAHPIHGETCHLTESNVPPTRGDSWQARLKQVVQSNGDGSTERLPRTNNLFAGTNETLHTMSSGNHAAKQRN